MDISKFSENPTRKGQSIMDRLEYAAIVAATLREIADWGTLLDIDWHGLANHVESWSLDPDHDYSCPVCQEIDCDEGCPLQPVRGKCCG